MQDIDSLIGRVLENYKSAVYAKDVAAFMKLYDPKVRVFDTWGVWSYEGAAAWQMAVEAWLTSLGTEKVQVAFDEVQVSGSIDFALVSAVGTTIGSGAETSLPVKKATMRSHQLR